MWDQSSKLTHSPHTFILLTEKSLRRPLSSAVLLAGEDPAKPDEQHLAEFVLLCSRQKYEFLGSSQRTRAKRAVIF